MKRVFTQNKNISFIDYNNSLKSNTMLENSLTHGRNYKGQNFSIRNNEFVYFSNYSSFFDISKGYFRRFIDAPQCDSPFTVNEGKLSSVYNESKKDPYTICLRDVDNQCLYPYGKYVNKNKKEYFNFLTKLVIPNDKNKCVNICHRNSIFECDKHHSI
jgi:hypothetical protein